jgi:hypothetical protein
MVLGFSLIQYVSNGKFAGLSNIGFALSDT